MDNEFKEMEANEGSGSNDPIIPLDGQLAELIETVFACERSARQLDRIESALRYGSRGTRS
jgi:hypothetical protein